MCLYQASAVCGSHRHWEVGVREGEDDEQPGQGALPAFLHQLLRSHHWKPEPGIRAAPLFCINVIKPLDILTPILRMSSKCYICYFLRNREHLFKSLNIYFSKEHFVNEISLSGRPWNNYFLMGVCGQIHVMWGVLDMEKFDSHRFGGQNRGQNIHSVLFCFL